MVRQPHSSRLLVLDETQPAPQTFPFRTAPTGIPGLDDVLGGGLPTGHLSRRGRPGSGKTTLGLHFLLEGVRADEKGLYVTLSETASELRTSRLARMDLDGIELFELVSSEGLSPTWNSRSCIPRRSNWARPCAA